MSRRMPLLLLAVLALVVAGCGGSDGASSKSSKTEYVKQLKEVGATLQGELSRLGSQIQGADAAAKLGAQLTDGAASLDTAAAKLAKITPPDDAKTEHTEIVAGIRELADTFRAGAKDAAGGRLSKVQATFTTIASSPGVKKVQVATAALKKKGFDVSG